jgi:hypothetical protein
MAGAAVDALGAGWHEPMQRIVLPLRDGTGAVRSWTARSVDGRTPKYLTGNLPDGFVAELAQGDEDCWPVVTEDWLSACKLGLAGVHAVSMLGTHPKPATLLRLINFKDLFVWLDNDLPPKHRFNYGQHFAAKVCRTLRAYGVHVVNVVSDAEPKAMSRSDIRSLLARSAASHTT